MKTLTNAEIFNEYYESIKGNYPHLTRDQIKEACMFPWKLMNRKMKEPNLPSIRLKYFGQWVVKEGRVRHLKGLLDGRKDRMFEQTYLEQKETYETYLKMKYEDLLEQFGFKEFKENIKLADFMRTYSKEDCLITIDTKTNKFSMSLIGRQSLDIKAYWFNSYDLLKEILKKA